MPLNSPMRTLLTCSAILPITRLFAPAANEPSASGPKGRIFSTSTGRRLTRSSTNYSSSTPSTARLSLFFQMRYVCRLSPTMASPVKSFTSSEVLSSFAWP